jgi:hypothetical protein
MNNIEESTHIGAEVQFAVLGRTIALYKVNGDSITKLLEQAAELRQHEYEIADRATLFAALTRQLGDAHRAGRDTAPLIKRLVDLWRLEVFGTPIPPC